MAIFYWKGGTSPNGLWSAPGQWWKDAAFTVAAGDYPHNATDIAVLTSGASDNITEFGEAISIAALIDFTAFDDVGRLTATDYTLTVGSASFLANYADNEVSIIGNCIFSGDSCKNSGIIVGNCIFSNGSTNYDTITGDCIFGDSSHNYGTITGDCIFNGTGGRNYSTINGNCILSGASFLNQSGTINGDCIFSGANSRNDTGGIITGTCVFKGATSNPVGTLNGNAIFHTATGISTTMNISGSIVPLVPVTATGTIGKRPLDILGAEI